MCPTRPRSRRLGSVDGEGCGVQIEVAVGPQGAGRTSGTVVDAVAVPAWEAGGSCCARCSSRSGWAGRPRRAGFACRSSRSRGTCRAGFARRSGGPGRARFTRRPGGTGGARRSGRAGFTCRSRRSGGPGCALLALFARGPGCTLRSGSPGLAWLPSRTRLSRKSCGPGSSRGAVGSSCAVGPRFSGFAFVPLRLSRRRRSHAGNSPVSAGGQPGDRDSARAAVQVLG